MTAAVLVALLVPLGVLARRLAEDRALGLARQEAQSVAVVAAVADADRLAAVVDAVNASETRRTTVFLPDGTQLGAPASPSASTRLAATGTAFTASTEGGLEVLLPVANAQGRAVVRTLVPSELLHRGVAQALMLLAGLGVGLMGLSAAVAWRIAGRIAGPVTELRAAADRLAEGDLTARVNPQGPSEVAAVGRAMNRLGARIGELLVAERELVADLSHRLRTPVTALRLDVDGLRDREEAARLGAHVDTLQETVTSVIETARRPLRHAEGPRCDARAVVADRFRFWNVLAEDQHRIMSMTLPDRAAPVAVDADELAAVVDALVENVFAHTREGTPLRVSVRTGTAPHTVEVAVSDSGGGIADADLAERGSSGAGSTGLGLDISRRTTEAAGGRLDIARSSQGGTCVTLHLPAAP